MAKVQNWSAVTSKEWNDLVNDLKDAVSESGGSITDFLHSADYNLSLSVEIAENKVSSLYERVNTLIKIEGYKEEEINTQSADDILLHIVVTFSSGTGSVHNVVPNVPG